MLREKVTVMAARRQGHHHAIAIERTLLMLRGRRDDTGIESKV
jgi:hypothetical protein